MKMCGVWGGPEELHLRPLLTEVSGNSRAMTSTFAQRVQSQRFESKVARGTGNRKPPSWSIFL